MPAIKLTASEWVEKNRRGAAVMVDGRRHVVAHKKGTGDPAYVEVHVENPDARCAMLDGRLDAEDMARSLIGFRGRTIPASKTMRYLRTTTDVNANVYVLDGDTGMVYILD